MEISWRKNKGSLKFLKDNIVIIDANYSGRMCGRSVDAQVRFVSQIDKN